MTRRGWYSRAIPSGPARLYDDLESDQSESGIKFVGPVPAEALRVLYHRAMALVYPSLYEGFGLPPLEAMAAGTPVVAMPFSSVPEVGGDAVLYAEGLSPADLARAMERIAASEELRAELRDRGLKRAFDFRWQQAARRGRGLSVGGALAVRAFAAHVQDVAGADPALGRALLGLGALEWAAGGSPGA